jgi:hypothetical protein
VRGTPRQNYDGASVRHHLYRVAFVTADSAGLREYGIGSPGKAEKYTAIDPQAASNGICLLEYARQLFTKRHKQHKMARANLELSARKELAQLKSLCSFS